MAMTAATTTRPALSMKLLIDTKAQRVLFAEANKDVVDFLFSLLSLPIATAVRLLGSGSMVGSVGSLYASVVKIDGAYVLSEDDLATLLHPTVSSQVAVSNLSLFQLPDPTSKEFFRCGSRRGFVQGVVTYTVTDNLTVTPMSSISSITLLNNSGVRDFGALQEKTVRIGYSEGLAILRASLHSKTVLTDVFLTKKRKA